MYDTLVATIGSTVDQSIKLQRLYDIIQLYDIIHDIRFDITHDIMHNKYDIIFNFMISYLLGQYHIWYHIWYQYKKLSYHIWYHVLPIPCATMISCKIHYIIDDIIKTSMISYSISQTPLFCPFLAPICMDITNDNIAEIMKKGYDIKITWYHRLFHTVSPMIWCDKCLWYQDYLIS